MSCFPCFTSKETKSDDEDVPIASVKVSPLPSSLPPSAPNTSKPDETITTNAKSFNFRELASATKNFRQECLLGEGGYGRVYKGTLQPDGQIVAVKQLYRNGMQESKEFLVEVLTLSLLQHPNLVKLIGYCADGEQRLLVHEYMPLGSVDDQLLGTPSEEKPLEWLARMKIASGIAEGLEYLHEKANPPILYHDLKPSNILLDESFSPKLSDFGLSKLGVAGNRMGTYGYCAPEHQQSGEQTSKADVYSFGVILLELITGRRAVDTTRPTEEQNLVAWAQPIFKDPKRFPEMADPRLRKQFPVKSINQAVGIAAMCLQEEASVRPLISDVVAALTFLALVPPDQEAVPLPNLAQASTPGSTRHTSDGEESNVSDHESASSLDDENAVNDVNNGKIRSNNDNKDEDYPDGEDMNDYSKDEPCFEDGRNSCSSDGSSIEYFDEDSADDQDQGGTKSMKIGSKSKKKSRKEELDDESEDSSSTRSSDSESPQ